MSEETKPPCHDKMEPAEEGAPKPGTTQSLHETLMRQHEMGIEQRPTKIDQPTEHRDRDDNTERGGGE